MRYRTLLAVLSVAGLAPGVSLGQAVPRTDTPRAGTLRVTFDPEITTWDAEYTAGGRRRLGATLPATVFIHTERRNTPLTLELGVTDRISVMARVPTLRVNNRALVVQDSAGRGAALDSLLADTTYLYAPIATTPRYRRYNPGDAEVAGKVQLVAPTGAYGAAAQLLLRLPTGHQDSPNDLFDAGWGDHQTDVELAIIQELTVAEHFWLNLSVRAAQQRAATRERRVASPDSLLVPHAALSPLTWDPGDYLAIDAAPMLRFAGKATGGVFAIGVTASYYTKQRDRYAFATAADSIALATRLGAPRPASLLDAGTAERRLRLGVAATYVGPSVEGGFSIEQTVSGAGGIIPAATVFRLVLRTSRWPF